MADNPFGLSCCQTVIKTFERAASYAVTEEATFALMTAPLSNMRGASRSFIQHEDSIERLSNPPTTEQKSSLITSNASQSMNLKNLDKAEDNDEGFLQKIKGNFTGGVTDGTGNTIDADLFGGIFNSECIPCGDRLNALGQMNADMLKDYGKQWLAQWKQALSNFLQQIKDLLDVFNNLDKFVDLCALLRFLKDFVCIPDLQRILSALMALMAKVSFELGGVFDLIMGLIGPILSPFLSGLVDMLMRYLLLIIRPLECIIDALQNILRKLDYNVLFQNINTLDRNPKPKSRKEDPRGPIKIPFSDATIERRDIVEGEGALDQVQNTGDRAFNSTTDALGGSAIKEENARNQAAVDKAAANLRALDNAAKNVDASDPEASAKYKAKRKAAVQEYKDSVEKRDLSAIGRTNAAIDRTVASVKGAIFQLIGQLREAMETVEAFFADLVDEFGKIIGQYVGGQNGMVADIVKKFALVQMIGLIASIIAAFSRGDLGCDDEEDDIKVESIIPLQQGLQIWTDDEGDIHIEQDSDDIDKAIKVAVASIGKQAEPEDKIAADKGEAPETPGQKLKKLVEFTGDPVLDTEIARTTEALITPVKVTFKCPLQTGVADAEQINQWIQSLNS